MADYDVREVIEGKQYQGEDESIAYTLTVTNVGSNPTSPAATVSSVVGGSYTDVTSTNMPTGSASAVGDVITCPALKLLVAGTLYRVEVKYTISGNIYENYFFVEGQK
jgi:hypothetical protein